MNYQAAYDRLIAKARARTKPEGYTERHHVVPKSLGGSNDASNLVDLTAREHFLAHWLLAKIHGGYMWLAIQYMKNRHAKMGYSLTARKYGLIRKQINNAMKASWTEDKRKAKSKERARFIKENPERWEEIKRKHTEFCRSPQGREMRRQITTSFYKNNPERAQEIFQASRQSRQTKEFRKKRSELTLAQFTPEARQAASQKSIAQFSDPAARKVASEKKAAWFARDDNLEQWRLANAKAKGKPIKLTFDDGAEIEGLAIKQLARIIGAGNQTLSQFVNGKPNRRGNPIQWVHCKAPEYQGRKVVHAVFA